MGGCVVKSPPLPEPLSIERLLRARTRLESRRRLTPELRACFHLALSEFSREPACIQENARLTLQSGPTLLVFASGTQENEISVFQLQGHVQYEIRVPRWDARVARACSRHVARTVAELIHLLPAGSLSEKLLR